jgi:Flp pilus assembly protein TadG
MMLFGLFAMAALVIDLGFARVAQRQMQTAADAAALEGLRGEGMIDYEDRQAAAEQLFAWTFNESLGATKVDAGTVDFGAVVNFPGGAGASGLNASQLMRVDANNATDIQRRPSSLTPNHFSVAVQRGGVVNREFDLLAQGSSVPYLFARGSLLDRGRIGEGIAAGGVAMAETRPAVRVGPPVATLPGVVSVAYAIADWGAAPTNSRVITSDIFEGLSIGQIISVGDTTTPPPSGYCVIYDPNSSRVVGFGLLGRSVPPDGVVARWNATANRSAAGEALRLLSSAQRSDVLNANRSLSYALTSPVLVRN